MCCRSCFKFDYDLTVEPSDNVQQDSNEITYDTGEGIRLTSHSIIIRKLFDKKDKINAGYVNEKDDQNDTSSQDKAGDYDFGISVNHVSANGQASVKDDGYEDVTLQAVTETLEVDEPSGKAIENDKTNGVIITQPHSDGDPPGSQLFVDPDASASNMLSTNKPDGEANLPSEPSSKAPNSEDLKGEFERDLNESADVSEVRYGSDKQTIDNLQNEAPGEVAAEVNDFSVLDTAQESNQKVDDALLSGNLSDDDSEQSGDNLMHRDVSKMDLSEDDQTSIDSQEFEGNEEYIKRQDTALAAEDPPGYLTTSKPSSNVDESDKSSENDEQVLDSQAGETIDKTESRDHVGDDSPGEPENEADVETIASGDKQEPSKPKKGPAQSEEEEMTEEEIAMSWATNYYIGRI